MNEPNPMAVWEREHPDTYSHLIDRCPGHLVDTLSWYVVFGRPMGDFLTAVLSNNLSESFSRADLYNREAMFDIVSWMYNSAPGNCWGNAEIVNEWLRTGGWEGQRKTAEGEIRQEERGD